MYSHFLYTYRIKSNSSLKQGSLNLFLSGLGFFCDAIGCFHCESKILKTSRLNPALTLIFNSVQWMFKWNYAKRHNMKASHLPPFSYRIVQNAIWDLFFEFFSFIYSLFSRAFRRLYFSISIKRSRTEPWSSHHVNFFALVMITQVVKISSPRIHSNKNGSEGSCVKYIMIKLAKPQTTHGNTPEKALADGRPSCKDAILLFSLLPSVRSWLKKHKHFRL